MTRFALRAALASALFALVAPTGFATPKIKIVEVLGAGSGCPVDEEGNPADWNVAIDNDKGTLGVEFSSFLVSPEFKTAACHLRIWLSVPQGYKAFAYASNFSGFAETTASDYGIFAATMSVGETEFPPISHTIRSGSEGEWATKANKAPIKAEIPCGGDIIKLDYRLNLSLFGKASEIQLAGHGGSFADVKFETKTCD